MAAGYHPEVEAHQKKVDAMDEKVLEDMLKTEGRGMLDLQIEIFDKPLKVIEGCGPLDNNGNEITKFTDTGMTTKKAEIQDTSTIVGLLFQEVGSQTWITRL